MLSVPANTACRNSCCVRVNKGCWSVGSDPSFGVSGSGGVGVIGVRYEVTGFWNDPQREIPRGGTRVKTRGGYPCKNTEWVPV